MEKEVPSVVRKIKNKTKSNRKCRYRMPDKVIHIIILTFLQPIKLFLEYYLFHLT